MEYYLANKKNEIVSFVANMYGPGDYLSKWNKSDRGKTNIWYYYM